MLPLAAGIYSFDILRFSEGLNNIGLWSEGY